MAFRENQKLKSICFGLHFLNTISRTRLVTLVYSEISRTTMLLSFLRDPEVGTWGIRLPNILGLRNLLQLGFYKAYFCWHEEFFEFTSTALVPTWRCDKWDPICLAVRSCKFRWSDSTKWALEQTTFNHFLCFTFCHFTWIPFGGLVDIRPASPVILCFPWTVVLFPNKNVIEFLPSMWFPHHTDLGQWTFT